MRAARWRWRRWRRSGRVAADAPDLSCAQVVELLTDFFDDALSPADRDQVASHLAACPDCTRYVAQLRATIAALGGIEQPALSDEAYAVLVAAFRGMRR